jgi:hypothetical protein
MGLFDNWGNWDADPAKNDAMNRAINEFAANLLSHSATNRNGAFGVGQSLQAGMQGYDQSMQNTRRNELIGSQIEENKSQNAFRAAQMLELQRKAAQLAQLQAVGLRMYGLGTPEQNNFDTGQQALGKVQAAGGQAGPTTQAATAQDAVKSQPRFPSLHEIAAYGALGGKSDDMLAIEKERTTPKEIKAGSYASVGGSPFNFYGDPKEGVTINNGVVSVMPGADQARSQLTAAQKGAEAQFTPYEVVMPDGSKTVMSLYDALVGARTARNEATAPTGAPAGGNRTTEPPQDILDRNRRDANLGDANKTWIDLTLKPVVTQGQQAEQQLQTIQAARAALAKVPTGQFAPIAQYGASILNGLGLAPESTKRFLASAEGFGAIFNDAVLIKQLAQAGVQTESDARRMEKTYASLKNSVQGNEFILNYMQALAEIQAAKKNFYSEMHQAYILKGEKNLNAIDQMWQRAKPPSIFAMPSMRGYAGGQVQDIPR